MAIDEAQRLSSVPAAMWRVTMQPADWTAREVRSEVARDALRRDAIHQIGEIRDILSRSVAERFELDVHAEPDDPEAYKDGLDETLELVRRAREFMASEVTERFARKLDQVVPDLAADYREVRKQYIAYALDTEKVLVFHGAGNDHDVDRFPDLFPAAG